MSPDVLASIAMLTLALSIFSLSIVWAARMLSGGEARDLRHLRRERRRTMRKIRRNLTWGGVNKLRRHLEDLDRRIDLAEAQATDLTDDEH